MNPDGGDHRPVAEGTDPFAQWGHCRIGPAPVIRMDGDALLEGVYALAAAGGQPRLMAYANAWTVGLATDHPDLAAAMQDERTVVYADGQSVVWAARLLGRPLAGRVNAGDMWPALLEGLARRGLGVYFLGGEPGLSGRAAHAALVSAPTLHVAGTADGFFDPDHDEAIVQAIRNARPAVVLVGMGSPRQERWARRRLDDLGAPVVWCVGALFEYGAGARSRAPVWMRACGLEWVWRLALEPRRLWRRYLLGNCRFVAIVARQMARERFGKRTRQP